MQEGLERDQSYVCYARRPGVGPEPSIYGFICMMLRRLREYGCGERGYGAGVGMLYFVGVFLFFEGVRGWLWDGLIV